MLVLVNSLSWEDAAATSGRTKSDRCSIPGIWSRCTRLTTWMMMSIQTTDAYLFFSVFYSIPMLERFNKRSGRRPPPWPQSDRLQLCCLTLWVTSPSGHTVRVDQTRASLVGMMLWLVCNWYILCACAFIPRVCSMTTAYSDTCISSTKKVCPTPKWMPNHSRLKKSYQSKRKRTPFGLSSVKTTLPCITCIYPTISSTKANCSGRSISEKSSCGNNSVSACWR